MRYKLCPVRIIEKGMMMIATNYVVQSLQESKFEDAGESVLAELRNARGLLNNAAYDIEKEISRLEQARETGALPEQFWGSAEEGAASMGESILRNHANHTKDSAIRLSNLKGRLEVLASWGRMINKGEED